MGLCLGLAVEIEPRVDGRHAASKPLPLPPLDRLDRRHGLSNGRARHGGSRWRCVSRSSWS
jgi:hypothetical protein